MAKSFEILEARIMREIYEIKFILSSLQLNKRNYAPPPVNSVEAYPIDNFIKIYASGMQFSSFNQQQLETSSVSQPEKNFTFPQSNMLSNNVPYSSFGESAQKLISNTSANLLNKYNNNVQPLNPPVSSDRIMESTYTESSTAKQQKLHGSTEKIIEFKPVQTKSLHKMLSDKTSKKKQ